ncbi:hypothetical protein Hdeb2414_s0017g00505101 [Helianthus debilis subsp. tardiflorus]
MYLVSKLPPLLLQCLSSSSKYHSSNQRLSNPIRVTHHQPINTPSNSLYKQYFRQSHLTPDPFKYSTSHLLFTHKKHTHLSTLFTFKDSRVNAFILKLVRLPHRWCSAAVVQT